MDPFYCLLGDSLCQVKLVPQASFRSLDHMGEADLEDTDSVPEIHVSEDLHGELRCQVLVHEGLHRIFPFLTEDSVDKAACQLGRLLALAGYRQQD